MVEIFAGSAILCSISKQFGLASSIAVDKVRKSFARCTIFQLDLTLEKDVSLLESWLKAPMLLWIHLAPVCGTASRARDIQREPGDPLPLRSMDHPDGLLDLSDSDRERVRLANRLYDVACYIFIQASLMGILATMENPSSSYFWFTSWVLRLVQRLHVFFTDFQVCMYGGLRNKWTRIMANFSGITAMDAVCDNSHEHLPWRFATDSQGKRVWATSLESQYPRKLCVVLVSLVLQFAEQRGLRLKATSLSDEAANPLASAPLAHVGASQQPRPARLAPVVPDFASVAVFLAITARDIPCQLLSKLSSPLALHSVEGVPTEVPVNSRFLRITERAPPADKGGREQVLHSNFPFEVAFGLPWTWEGFVNKACAVGHPSTMNFGVPDELQHVLDVHSQWTHAQLSKYRLDWCRKWIKRASELDADEKVAAADREPAVAAISSSKRVLLMREMLQDIGYSDVEAVSLFEDGATLAGEVQQSPVFKQHFKPGLMTMEQLSRESSRRNQVVLNLTKPSGDADLDQILLSETKEEISLGWLEGPFKLDELEEGATISRRFALRQGAKTRLIDDFSVSGVNDSCVSHGKIELRLVDTFTSLVRAFFRQSNENGSDSTLLAKTYDLKSAYRQVPIHPRHRKFGYISVYNHELDEVQIYRLKTLSFGATHSVYCFLRLARTIFAVATMGLKLLSTNFYDDFILASQPELVDSSKNAMELLFLLTGWSYAKSGKKATQFDCVCKALGVEFNFSRSAESVLLVDNTASKEGGTHCHDLRGSVQRHFGQAAVVGVAWEVGFCRFLHAWAAWVTAS